MGWLILHMAHSRDQNCSLAPLFGGFPFGFPMDESAPDAQKKRDCGSALCFPLKGRSIPPHKAKSSGPFGSAGGPRFLRPRCVPWHGSRPTTSARRCKMRSRPRDASGCLAADGNGWSGCVEQPQVVYKHLFVIPTQCKLF